MSFENYEKMMRKQPHVVLQTWSNTTLASSSWKDKEDIKSRLLVIVFNEDVTQNEVTFILRQLVPISKANNLWLYIVIPIACMILIFVVVGCFCCGSKDNGSSDFYGINDYGDDSSDDYDGYGGNDNNYGGGNTSGGQSFSGYVD